jgi:hypothetical protein
MPRRKLSKPDYPKELTTPIEVVYPKTPTLLADNYEKAMDDYRKAWKKLQLKITIKKIKKMGLLAKYYGLEISKLDISNPLLIRVCSDCVDGFKVVTHKPTGRGKLWNNTLLYLLWYDIRELQISRNFTVSAACHTLLQKSPWREILSSRKNNSRNLRPQKFMANYYPEAEASAWVRFAKNVDAALHKKRKSYDVYKKIYEMLLQHQNYHQRS